MILHLVGKDLNEEDVTRKPIYRCSECLKLLLCTIGEYGFMHCVYNVVYNIHICYSPETNKINFKISFELLITILFSCNEYPSIMSSMVL